MDFQLLGPIEAFATDGRLIQLGGRRQQAVLAALLLEPGKLVSVDRLTRVIWDGEPPETARGQVQSCVSTLRRRLGSRIDSKYYGYVMQVAPEQVDLGVHRARVEAARALVIEGRAEPAVPLYRAALSLWQGGILGGVPGLVGEAVRLEEERLAVTGEILEVELSLGRHAALIGELRALVAQHPLRERFRGLLMVALCRSGRKAEALQLYGEARELMVTRLGVEPGAQLQTLFQQILADESDLLRPPDAAPSATTSPAATGHEDCAHCGTGRTPVPCA